LHIPKTSRALTLIPLTPSIPIPTSHNILFLPKQEDVLQPFMQTVL
jgi:hypothetical protein